MPTAVEERAFVRKPTEIDRLVAGIDDAGEVLGEARGVFTREALPYFQQGAGRCFFCARAMQHSAALLAAVTLAIEDLRRVSGGEE